MKVIPNFSDYYITMETYFLIFRRNKMKYVVIENVYNDGGDSGPYSSPSCGWFDHKVRTICDTKEQAKKYCEEKFNNFGCSIQEVSN